MEAFAGRYSPFQLRLYTSPLSTRTHHRLLQLRHHGGVGRRSSMRFHSIQRITAAVNRSQHKPVQFSFRSTNFFDLSFDLNFNVTMDDSDAKKEIKAGDGLSVAKDTKETQKPQEIPPPPEKPLPGDCCGSGCVRCVWDVYYEELEEYNKLYKGGSDSTIGSKVL